MTFKTTAQSMLLLALLASWIPATSVAKPNSYPGENSKFKASDPEVEARRKAQKQKRIEQRKQRREERRLRRLNRQNNRSN